MTFESKYVLVEDIHKYEEEGWVLSSNKVALRLGGWSSVIMTRPIEKGGINER